MGSSASPPPSTSCTVILHFLGSISIDGMHLIVSVRESVITGFTRVNLSLVFCHISHPLSSMRLLLSLLVLLRTAASRAACPAALALPPSGLPDVASPPEKAGWCAPYASAASTLDGVRTPAGVCRGITVPAGAVLEFGTCALPGAACTGATALSLLYAAALPTDPPLLSLEQVTLNSAVAYLSAGCTLGVRCSSGEWRNNNLTTAAVVIYEACAGRDSCVGVRASTVRALLPQSLTNPFAGGCLAHHLHARAAAAPASERHAGAGV